VTTITVVTGGEVVAAEGTGGTDPDTLAERLRVLHRRGLSFHHDPGEGRLVCYVAGVRQVPEQFYVEFVGETARGTDAFEKLSASLAHLERDADWSLDTGGSGKQAVFDALAAGTVATPADPDGVATLLQERDRPVELGTPDETTAAGLYRWLRGRESDFRVTVCSGGAVDELPPTDVVIVPDGADTVGAPAGATRYRRAQERREAAVRQAREELRGALSAARSTAGSDRAARRRVAVALDAAGVPDTGVRIRPRRGAADHLRRGVAWLLLGLPLGLLLGGTAVLGMGRPQGALELLTRQVDLGVPVVARQLVGPVPVWWPLGTAVAVVAVVLAVNVAGRRRTTARETPDPDVSGVRTALVTLRDSPLTTTDAGTGRREPGGRLTAGIRRAVGRLASDDSGDGDVDRLSRLVAEQVLAGLPFRARPADSGSARTAVRLAATVCSLVVGVAGGWGLLLAVTALDPVAANVLVVLNGTGAVAVLAVVSAVARRVI